jgi:hypothetical protein
MTPLRDLHLATLKTLSSSYLQNLPMTPLGDLHLATLKTLSSSLSTKPANDPTWGLAFGNSENTLLFFICKTCQ